MFAEYVSLNAMRAATGSPMQPESYAERLAISCVQTTEMRSSFRHPATDRPGLLDSGVPAREAVQNVGQREPAAQLSPASRERREDGWLRVLREFVRHHARCVLGQDRYR
jgi:hypothetical protein